MSHNMRRREGLDYFMVHKTNRKSNRQCASEALGQLATKPGDFIPTEHLHHCPSTHPYLKTEAANREAYRQISECMHRVPSGEVADCLSVCLKQRFLRGKVTEGK